MNFLLILFIMLLGPFIGATIFRKNFATTISIYFSLIMFFLFIFYVFNKLKLGFFIFLFLLTILSLYSIYLLIRKPDSRQSLYRNFLSPELFVFVLLGLFFRMYLRSSVPVFYDELRQWAAMPKAIYYTQSLQLYEDSIILPGMRSYFPGLALLQYFFMQFNFKYSDWILFYVYALLGVSLMLPACKRIKKIGYWAVPIVSLVIFFLPLTFYNPGFEYSDGSTYYKTLFIDGLLGVALAGAFESLWSVLDNSSVYNYIRFSFSLFTLLLLKESGLLFSILLVLVFIIGYIIIHKHIKSELLKLFFAIIPLFVVKYIWTWTLARFNQTPSDGNWLSINSILNFIFSPSEENINITHTFIDFLITKKLIIPAWPTLYGYFPFLFSWVGFISVYIALATILIIRIKKHSSLIIFIGALIIDVLYEFSLLIMYAIGWNNSIQCFERYSNTAMLSLYILLFIGLGHIIETSENFTKTLIYFSIAYIVLFPFYERKTYGTLDYEQSIMVEKSATVAATILNKENNYIDVSGVSLFFLTPGGGEYCKYHHNMYYKLIENHIYIKHGYTDSLVTDSDTQKYLNNKLAKYNYLYIHDSTNIDYIKKTFGDSFIGGADNVISNGVYSIVMRDNNVYLNLIN